MINSYVDFVSEQFNCISRWFPAGRHRWQQAYGKQKQELFFKLLQNTCTHTHTHTHTHRYICTLVYIIYYFNYIFTEYCFNVNNNTHIYIALISSVIVDWALKSSFLPSFLLMYNHYRVCISKQFLPALLLKLNANLILLHSLSLAVVFEDFHNTLW